MRSLGVLFNEYSRLGQANSARLPERGLLLFFKVFPLPCRGSPLMGRHVLYERYIRIGVFYILQRGKGFWGKRGFFLLLAEGRGP